MMRKRVPFWSSVGMLITFGLAGLVTVGSFAEEPSARQQQIADLEKQVEALTKKLNELRAAPVPQSMSTLPEGTLPAGWTKALKWRSIGPASMGGRITGISVFEADPSTYFVATASGGLLKTVNNGFSFEHQFDHEATVSIGAVCVAPSNRKIVWVGTGENNPRNSVSYGDGVYKSTDGGATWKNMGLKQSFQIGSIVVHPTNPDIVYVGALGRLYGPNPERGLYKTVDGGNTWERILYLDDRTGIIEMRMHPTNPDTLLVAAWERLRDGYDSSPGGNVPDGYDGYDPIKKWGPNAGIYKTTDGGKTFTKLTKGLPTGMLGRIGLDYYQKDPNIVFAIVDCEKIGMGTPPKATPNLTVGARFEDADEDQGARVLFVMPDSSADQAGMRPGDVIRKLDDKGIRNEDDWTTALGAHKANDKVKVVYVREKEEKTVELTVTEQAAGGGRGARGVRGGSGVGHGGPGGATLTRP
jgi:hypothetical protein